eukprot:11329-Heterococcus_DN1.PRE.4
MSTGTNSVYNCAVCSHWLAAVPLRAGTVSHTELHALHCACSKRLRARAYMLCAAAACYCAKLLMLTMLAYARAC